ncbi:MAG: hypothetical protein OEM51_01700 [Gammaproteobacteria bacterium]|nr:hypothetical protein [Gammaproteobacteria bacterium]
MLIQALAGSLVLATVRLQEIDMFDIFAGLFDQTALTLRFTPDMMSVQKVIAYTALNTTIRALALAGFTYGAIRVVITAVSHGSF